jgi:acyl-CoA synthetase (AMP-forming)/AMP-acid ligase II
VRISVLGGGPGGPLAALPAKRGDPAREVTVFEHNRAGGTFGFGVVFPTPPWTASTQPGRDISLGAISDGLEAAGVATFKWPERLEIVAELPVTKMGKLDKKALRDMLAGRSTP